MAGIGFGPHVHCHAGEEVAPKVGNKRLRRDIVAQIRILDVLHHADDFHVGMRSRIGPKAEMTADGILPGEIAPREALVDHHRRRRPVVRLGTVLDLAVIVGREIPPLDNGHVKGSKIVRADLVHVGLRMIVGFCGRVALHCHPAIPFVVLENTHRCQTNGLNSRNRAEAIRQLLIENLRSVRCITTERGVDVEPHQALRREARTQAAQVFQTAEEEPRTYEEQQRKRHLRDDQRLPQPAVPAHYRTRLVFECLPDVRLCRLQRRHEPKNQSGDNRHRQRKRKNA